MITDVPTDRHITLQHAMRRCGKDRCTRCKAQATHGPYWYAFWRDDAGALHSAYIGRKLPHYLMSHVKGQKHVKAGGGGAA